MRENIFPGNPMTYVYGVTYLSTAVASGQYRAYMLEVSGCGVVDPF